MELKSEKSSLYDITKALLIEPYGIEIVRDRRRDRIEGLLLIEPYGIEIKKPLTNIRENDFLLIEPYGIEISYAHAPFPVVLPFNRTLWN